MKWKIRKTFARLRGSLIFQANTSKIARCFPELPTQCSWNVAFSSEQSRVLKRENGEVWTRWQRARLVSLQSVQSTFTHDLSLDTHKKLMRTCLLLVEK